MIKTKPEDLPKIMNMLEKFKKGNSGEVVEKLKLIKKKIKPAQYFGNDAKEIQPSQQFIILLDSS